VSRHPRAGRPRPDGRTLVYVLAVFPTVSQTFVSGEIGELVRRGVDVRVFSLRPVTEDGPLHPGVDALVARTTYLPAGVRALPTFALAALLMLVRHPLRTSATLFWALRHSIRRRSVGELGRFAQAVCVARRLPRGAGHIHTHFAHGPATAAMLVSRLSGVPYSFTAHARDIFEYVDPAALRDKVAAAAAVVAVSEHGRAHLRDVVGADLGRRVALIRNGIDLEQFSPNGGPPAGPARILAVSRMVEKKGLDTLVDAVAVLRARGHDVICEIAGDGPLRAELVARAERLGIGDRVHMLGSVDADAVGAAYHRATIMALPCRRDSNGDQDGLPVSLVEAMATGVPVVSTPVSGIPELIEDGVSGLLVPPDDPDALAAAFARILDDPELRHALATQGRAVAETYDRTFWVSRLVELVPALQQTG
jgi:glycosyltransferase involved in cell wall biosynthesis